MIIDKESKNSALGLGWKFFTAQEIVDNKAPGIPESLVKAAEYMCNAKQGNAELVLSWYHNGDQMSQWSNTSDGVDIYLNTSELL